MFRHIGKTRTIIHNLKLASLLSFVAGIVNITGYFAVQRLTTNVTGHFAFFADEVFKREYNMAWVYLLYILAFFVGAFFSSLLVELVARKSQRYIYVVPVAMEILILIAVALMGKAKLLSSPDFFACSLLFAMGLQNSLVTSISNSVVRTTHLTGLFTDLGIELSQLFFFKKPEQRHKLLGSIRLRLAIISFFFLGCLIGGYFCVKFGILSLLLAAALLLVGIGYDTVRFKFVTLKRKYLH